MNPPRWTRSLLLTSMAAACGTAAAAGAQDAADAAAPAPATGDTWIYRRVDLYTGLEIDRFSMRFVRREASELRFELAGRDDNPRPVARTLDLGSCNRAKDIPEAKCGSVYRFPLRLGARSGWAKLPNADAFGTSDQDCVVAAKESVTVPAGTFQAWRVDCGGIWMSGLGELDYIYQGQLRQVHWYAPSIHGEVKSIVRVWKNKGGLESQELTELMSFANISDAAAAAAARARAVAALPSPKMPAEFSSGTTRFAGRFARNADNTAYSGEGKVSWANGDIYEGMLVSGTREGRGRFDWANGQRYEGEWQADKPHGRGVMRFANGDVFDGEFVSGETRGTGAMTYASGDRYEGEVAAGVPHGRGRYTSAHGQVLECAWVQGKGQGRGRLQFANGDIYEGELKDGLPEGIGRTIYASGDRYEGTLVAGRPHGRGSYTWKSGALYEGEWKAGQKDGRGRFTAADGASSEVIFAEDRRLPQ